METSLGWLVSYVLLRSWWFWLVVCAQATLDVVCVVCIYLCRNRSSYKERVGTWVSSLCWRNLRIRSDAWTKSTTPPTFVISSSSSSTQATVFWVRLLDAAAVSVEFNFVKCFSLFTAPFESGSFSLSISSVGIFVLPIRSISNVNSATAASVCCFFDRFFFFERLLEFAITDVVSIFVPNKVDINRCSASISTSSVSSSWFTGGWCLCCSFRFLGIIVCCSFFFSVFDVSPFWLAEAVNGDAIMLYVYIQAKFTVD